LDGKYANNMKFNADLIIRNANISNHDNSFQADIVIKDGAIARVEKDTLVTGKNEIDVKGMLVTPGAIDSHCHVDQVSSSGVTTADNFLTASRTAAFGGITTIIPFAAQKKGVSLVTTVEEYHTLAHGNSLIDYGFHTIISDLSDDDVSMHMETLIQNGCTSFKVYMTYEAVKLSDRNIIKVLDLARRYKVTVMIHAESHDLLTWLTENLIKNKKIHTRFHAEARPRAIEREAIHRAISMAEVVGARVLIVHVSGKDGVEQLRWARAHNIKVYAETCPQYLTLTSTELDRENFEGAKYCCSPPLRDTESIEALWAAIDEDIIEVYSSDHSVYRFNDINGKKIHGETAPFYKIPMGIPGLATSIPILFSEGVMKRRLSVEKFVSLSSWNAAKLYGLDHCKGRIAKGYDADLVIWDRTAKKVLTHTDIEGVADYSPYEGLEVFGWPSTTIARGEIVCRDNLVCGVPGHGSFLHCKTGREI